MRDETAVPDHAFVADFRSAVERYFEAVDQWETAYRRYYRQPDCGEKVSADLETEHSGYCARRRELEQMLPRARRLCLKHGLREPWWGQMRELARLPNVVCKVSGVITEADHDAWTKEQVKPYVAHTLECFGFDRVMYGSDWTVSELSHSYPTWVEILDEVVVGASKEEVRKLYRDTAIRVYRLAE